MNRCKVRCERSTVEQDCARIVCSALLSVRSAASKSGSGESGWLPRQIVYSRISICEVLCTLKSAGPLVTKGMGSETE
jgi:hypothetical protein